MKNKLLSLVMCLGFLFVFTTSFTSLEARHSRTSFSVNFGQGYYAAPAPAYVVAPAPYYRAPVYVPEYAPVVYQPVYAQPVVQPVYVYPRPAYTGFSFGWGCYR